MNLWKKENNTIHGFLGRTTPRDIKIKKNGFFKIHFNYLITNEDTIMQRERRERERAIHKKTKVMLWELSH